MRVYGQRPQTYQSVSSRSRVTQTQEAATDVPRVEYQLVPLPPALLLKLKIVHGPARVLLGKIAEEVIVRIRLGDLVDDDLRVVVVELEDDVLGLLTELQVLVSADAIRVYTDAGGGLWNAVVMRTGRSL